MSNCTLASGRIGGALFVQQQLLADGQSRVVATTITHGKRRYHAFSNRGVEVKRFGSSITEM